MTCAKGITSGYLPLGAVLASRRIQEPFWSSPGEAVFRHGYTYSGHPAVCAAGLANLDIIEREGLVDRVAAHGVRAGGCGRAAALGAAGLGHPRRRSACSRPSRSTPRRAPPSRGWSTASWPSAATLGVMTRGLAGHSLQLSPPFVITEDELATVASVIADALSRVSVRASV